MRSFTITTSRVINVNSLHTGWMSEHMFETGLAIKCAGADGLTLLVGRQEGHLACKKTGC